VLTGSGDPAFVGRGGHKLLHALETFNVNTAGCTCADLGCNVGGFTDCLLQRNAAKVFAVDTGYGALAWKLRQDDRVVVMERTNALHVDPPDRVDLVVIDLGWTPQRHAVPAALRWVRNGGRIISLVKPHYELEADEKRLLVRGVLPESESERVGQRTRLRLGGHGVEVLGWTQSPMTGGASKGRKGNREFLALLAPAPRT